MILLAGGRTRTMPIGRYRNLGQEPLLDGLAAYTFWEFVHDFRELRYEQRSFQRSTTTTRLEARRRMES